MMSLLCSIYSWTKRQPLRASSIFIWCLSSWYFHVNRSPRDPQFTAVIKLAISDCRLLDRFFSFRRCYAVRLQFGFKFRLVCTGNREQQKWTKMLSVSLSSFSFSLCVRRAFWKRKTSFRVWSPGVKLLSSCIDVCPQPRQGTWPFLTEWLLATNGGTSSPPQSHLGYTLHNPSDNELKKKWVVFVQMKFHLNEFAQCKFQLNAMQFNWI
jgi:hypothetical protein